VDASTGNWLETFIPSVLQTGEGNDTVSIAASATGNWTNAWAVRASTIDTGSGDDSVTLSASTTNESFPNNGTIASAFTIAESRVYLGDGSDSLTITSTGTTVSDSTIDMGSGDDSVTLSSEISRNTSQSRAVAISLSQVYLGDGSDSLTITSIAKNREGLVSSAVEHSTIDSGKGSQDIITVNSIIDNSSLQASVNVYSNCRALSDSSILTNDGNDIISISAKAIGFSDLHDFHVKALANALVDSGSGSDVINITGGWEGSSIVQGGSGLDVLRLSDLASVTIKKATDFTSDNLRFTITSGGQVLTISGIEQIVVGKSIHNLATFRKNGSSKSEKINLGSSADILNSAGGDDSVNAGAGSDVINGGSGDDRLFGQDGADALYGDQGNDLLDGGNQNDELDGGSGNDQLFGGWGDDELTGGIGSDLLAGGHGNDILTGTTSDGSSLINEVDIMSGGMGSDTFVLGDSSKSFYAKGSYKDLAWIQDISESDGDRLRLHGSIEMYQVREFVYNGITGTALYYSESDAQELDMIAFFSGKFDKIHLASISHFEHS